MYESEETEDYLKNYLKSPNKRFLPKIKNTPKGSIN